MMQRYRQFLERKTQYGGDSGFAPLWMPDYLFDFQKALVEWACLKGRGAIFADCGLGKTPMQLVWAENVVKRTRGRVLILTPLAVSAQTIREADKFGISAKIARDGSLSDGLNVANYQRLHYYRPEDFVGVVCDESSILKSFDGATRQALTVFLRKIPYRLLCTATAAPNDYIELGTSSEALGYLGHMDMLGRFFRNQNGNSTDTKGHWRGFHAPRSFENKQWRFKGHAETPFWRWVCSWARACRRPSDLGFDDAAFILPPLEEIEHTVQNTKARDGMLFSLPALTLVEQREERRITIRERCEYVASLVNNTGEPALVWCHLNEEGDLLSRLIPDSVQVAGSDTDEYKEGRMLDFADGKVRVLVTKPKIGAWGMNFQHCAHITVFPSHSYEQYYQGMRRCWRFGQKRPVRVDIVTTDGEHGVLANLQRKSAQADKMFTSLVSEMSEAMSIDRAKEYNFQEEVPSWL